jgi:hypothetical protein
MWKTLKLSSERFEVYKEENGNTVMVYPETFGTPEEAVAKIARLTDGVEAEPVDGVAQRPPVADKPVDSVQPPAAETPTPVTEPVATPGVDPVVPVDADATKSDADASASEASAEGSETASDGNEAGN